MSANPPISIQPSETVPQKSYPFFSEERPNLGIPELGKALNVDAAASKGFNTTPIDPNSFRSNLLQMAQSGNLLAIKHAETEYGKTVVNEVHLAASDQIREATAAKNEVRQRDTVEATDLAAIMMALKVKSQADSQHLKTTQATIANGQRESLGNHNLMPLLEDATNVANLHAGVCEALGFYSNGVKEVPNSEASASIQARELRKVGRVYGAILVVDGFMRENIYSTLGSQPDSEVSGRINNALRILQEFSEDHPALPQREEPLETILRALPDLPFLDETLNLAKGKIPENYRVEALTKAFSAVNETRMGEVRAAISTFPDKYIEKKWGRVLEQSDSLNQAAALEISDRTRIQKMLEIMITGLNGNLPRQRKVVEALQQALQAINYSRNIAFGSVNIGANGRITEESDGRITLSTSSGIERTDYVIANNPLAGVFIIAEQLAAANTSDRIQVPGQTNAKNSAEAFGLMERLRESISLCGLSLEPKHAVADIILLLDRTNVKPTGFSKRATLTDLLTDRDHIQASLKTGEGEDVVRTLKAQNLTGNTDLLPQIQAVINQATEIQEQLSMVGRNKSKEATPGTEGSAQIQALFRTGQIISNDVVGGLMRNLDAIQVRQSEPEGVFRRRRIIIDEIAQLGRILTEVPALAIDGQPGTSFLVDETTRQNVEDIITGKIKDLTEIERILNQVKEAAVRAFVGPDTAFEEPNLNALSDQALTEVNRRLGNLSAELAGSTYPQAALLKVNKRAETCREIIKRRELQRKEQELQEIEAIPETAKRLQEICPQTYRNIVARVERIKSDKRF